MLEFSRTGEGSKNLHFKRCQGSMHHTLEKNWIRENKQGQEPSGLGRRSSREQTLKSAFVTSYSGEPLPLGHSISRELKDTYYNCYFHLLVNQNSN